MRRVSRLLPVLAVLVVLAVMLMGKAVAENGVSLDTVLAKLAPPPSSEALTQIPDPGRKLLALWSYIRYGAKIPDRWSWTEEKIKEFEGSPEQQALLADIAAVNKHFSEANPGFEIYVHGTVRSLNEQLASWNKNNSVRTGAEEIMAAYEAAFGEDGLEPEEIDVKRLDAWLRDFQPSKRANLAAPGLTLHGRAGAIDFQVMKDGRIYAGANSAQVESVWRAEGWEQKLKASIEAVGPSFSGPLTKPDEPWHYEYAPSPQAQAEDVPEPRERPVAPAIVFLPGSGTSAKDQSGKWDGPVLTIYDSQSCDAKTAGECSLVTLTCDDPKGRGLGITVAAIETGQIVKWLEAEADGKAGMQLELEGLSADDQPAIAEMSSNSAGAGWRVTFYVPFTADLGLRVTGNVLSVKTMPRSVSLQLTDANRSALEQFIELCAR